MTNSRLRLELRRLVVLMTAVAVAGYFAGHITFALLLGLLGFLGWHAWQLVRLVNAVDYGMQQPGSDGKGIWPHLHSGIARMEARGRKRKRRTERLESRFHEAANALPDAAVLVGRRWGVIWANPAARQLLGVSYPECAGARLQDLIHQPALNEFVQRGNFNRSIDIQSPSNAGIVISVLVRPFGKKKRQNLLLARDITGTYHLDQARRDFVANVSHELRTPLTVITGFLELTLDPGMSREDIDQALRQMQHQAQRMEALISDLLALSKLEMDTEAPSTDVVEVDALLQAIISDAESIPGSAPGTITLAADPNVNLRGAYGELRSAFSNLIVNAIKHTPAGSLVHVDWQLTPSGADLAVRDTGEGIAARHIPRLTERFYRVDKGRSRDAGGTGLGLAIVKHALNRHGAELEIESKVGRGTTFTCHFPPERLEFPEKSDRAPRLPVQKSA